MEAPPGTANFNRHATNRAAGLAEAARAKILEFRSSLPGVPSTMLSSCTQLARRMVCTGSCQLVLDLWLCPYDHTCAVEAAASSSACLLAMVSTIALHENCYGGWNWCRTVCDVAHRDNKRFDWPFSFLFNEVARALHKSSS